MTATPPAPADQDGPALDARVATEVMHLADVYLGDSGLVHKKTKDASYWWAPVPAYSTDPAAALAVVERMAEQGWWARIESPFSPGECWEVTFMRHGHIVPTAPDPPPHIELAETMPLTICLAALAAVGEGASGG
jgi:hypothetical protein